MSIELTIILKDEERTYRQKFLIYEHVELHPMDEVIKRCVSESKKNFQGEPEDIQVKTLMVLQ